ncbi:MAG: biopolymer transporter ExbD [Lentisphaerae bacterium]|nr:biopolymer transporter ExbD [Lentisphaerota bacterium]MCP4101446.1 biopolymer transporter ExbD [Lentisphaerota bacterium]
MKNSFTHSFKSKLKPFGGRPDLTAMVDVLFLLLIFFMLGSSFVQVSGFKVDLPQVGASTTLGIEKFVITVAQADKKSQIFFNEQEVTWERLKQKLAEVRNNSASGTVVIRADRKTPFGVIARVMALAEKANVTAIVATMPAKEKKEAVFDPNEQ